jgi:hypothetical protein
VLAPLAVASLRSSTADAAAPPSTSLIPPSASSIITRTCWRARRGSRRAIKSGRGK